MFIRRTGELLAEIARLQQENTNLKIRAAVAEATAQHRLELLEQLRKPELNLLPGGFIPMPAPPSNESPFTVKGPTLFDRVNEVTDGLSLEEIQRRHEEFRSAQLASWEAERAKLEAELLLKKE